jgi:RNA-directed DNA polymerase
MCGQLMREDEQWQVHHRVKRSEGGGDELDNLELLHANCHRQLHSQEVGEEPCCVSQEALTEA